MRGNNPINPAQCHVRPAVPADESAMLAIAQDAFACYLPRMDRPPFPMLADYGKFIGSGQAWLAETHGEIAAILVLVPKSEDLMLDAIAVKSCYQKNGLGRLLINFALARARECGAKNLKIYTNAAMTENLLWYEKLGFTEIGRGVENDYNRVWMQKSLYPD